MMVLGLFMGGCNGVVANGVSLPNYHIVLIRSILAAAILGVLLLLERRRPTAMSYPREAIWVVGAGVALAGDWLFLFEAYGAIGVGLATILLYCAPIIVMALSPLIFHERLTVRKVAGFAIVVTGALLISGGTLQTGSSPYGILCGLASAGCYAAMTIISKKAVHISGLEKGFIEIGIATVALIVYAVVVHGATLATIVQIAPSDIVPLVVLGALIAFGNYLYLRAMNSVNAQRVAVLGYVEPLSAVVLGAIVLHETMTPPQFFGAICIVAGALFTELRIKPPSAAPGEEPQG